jgi:hypothetical protein
MPHPLNLVCGGSGTLLVRRQTCTLLPDRPDGVVLEVKQVLDVPSEQSHPDREVRALEVRHGLKALLPYGVLLILNREKCDRQCCCSGEAVLAQGGEGDVRHDGPRPRLCGVKGYRHANLTPIQAMGHGQSATVDQSVPVVAKTEEYVIKHSQDPRAMLACGT